MKTMKQADLVARLERKCGESRQSGTGFFNFARCPIASKAHSSKFTFGVNPKTGKWSCFACSKSGSLRGLGIDADRITHTGSAVTEWTLAAREVLPDGAKLPWAPLRPYATKRERLEELAVDYLTSRGVDLEHAANRGAGFGIAGKWVGYVVFPWYDDEGMLGGWQGRLCGEPDEGYAKVETTSPTRTLPNGRVVGDGDFVFKTTQGALGGIESVIAGQPVCVVEGPFDALSVSRVMPTVWLQGGQCHPAQYKRLLKRRPSAIIWGQDPDKYSEALKCARRYYNKGKVQHLIMEWGDYGGDWAADEDKSPTTRREVELFLFLARPFRPGE